MIAATLDGHIGRSANDSGTLCGGQERVLRKIAMFLLDDDGKSFSSRLLKWLLVVTKLRISNANTQWALLGNDSVILVASP